MEENKTPVTECDEECEAGAAAEEAVAEESLTPEDKEISDLRAKVAELEAAAKEKDDKYLRMAAEYDNFRRRSREEKEASYGAALADAVGAMLPIIDNLERAAAFDDGEKVREGVRMIAGSVGAALSSLGVEAYGEVGDKFDPNLHNAVLHEEDDSEREGEITEVF